MKHLTLIRKLLTREILSRYQGSTLGLAWSFINPLLMLSIYTIVFSEIFKMRWGGVNDDKILFAVMVFSGMLVLSFFSEVLTKAPSLIIHNVNYVKKVVFPLNVLSVVSVLTAVFQLLINLFILLIAVMIIQGSINLTALFLPIIILPLIILALGVSWAISAVGVYFRDIGELVSAITAILVFLSPVFYPMSAVPESLQRFILLNPLTFIIQQIRLVVVSGDVPYWLGLAQYSLVAMLIALMGYLLFEKTKRGFADVL